MFQKGCILYNCENLQLNHNVQKKLKASESVETKAEKANSNEATLVFVKCNVRVQVCSFRKKRKKAST